MEGRIAAAMASWAKKSLKVPRSVFSFWCEKRWLLLVIIGVFFSGVKAKDIIKEHPN